MLRRKIEGKFNGIKIADEYEEGNITVETFCKLQTDTTHVQPQQTQKLSLFLSVMMQVRRSCLCRQANPSSALLNAAMCLLKCVLNCEQRFTYFIFRKGLNVTGLARVCYIYKGFLT
jgi:hypothetical protein